MELKLYYGPGACSFAPHVALEELGFPYAAERLNLAAGDQRRPAYLALNPMGRVPTLVVDGKPLTENIAILAFLGGAFPAKGLWPKDTWGQARLLSAIAWCSTFAQSAYGHVARPGRYSDDAACQESMKAKGRETFWEHLRQVDGWLGKSPKWLMGEQYTVGDPFLFVLYRWGHRSGLPVKSLARYTRHTGRFLDRPAVRKVMADEGITLD